MDKFVGYSDFKIKIKKEYAYGEIDELTRQEGQRYWLDQGMYRWYRLCKAMGKTCHGRDFTLLDIGAFPFTALKVAKVMFPGARLMGSGLWDVNTDRMLKDDPLLKDGAFSLCNLDPWIMVAENLRDVPKDLPLPDNSVDFVIFTEVVEHLYNPAHVLKEIGRVLKKGGRVYLTTNNVSYWFYALRLLKGETNLDRDIDQITVDFERDYPHDWRGHVRFYSISQLEEMLSLAGIPLYAAERSQSNPLIIAGGAAFFINPEPVADFLDLVVIGEAEPVLPPLLAAILENDGVSRSELLRSLCKLPGIYVPSLYTPEYEEGRLVSVKAVADAPPRVQRVWATDLDSQPTGTRIHAPQAEFGDMHLVELSRGCPRGCRFCAAGFIYLPYRGRSLETIKRQVDNALQEHRRIGLVAAAVGDFRGIGELCRHILDAGGQVSVSSLRIDGLDGEMIDVLAASGHKTATLAPEGGSQRLRELIRKGITEEQILDACERLIARDILNLKLYFIIGLPTETDGDLAELVTLVEKIRLRVVERAKENRRLGEITLSVNPFIPKPWTPFQWCGMAPLRELERKVAWLRKTLGKVPNVRLQVEGLKEALLQALLSRGDRRLAPLLVAAADSGNWRRAAKELGMDLEALAGRTISLDELLPWEFIEGGNREYLVREYAAGMAHANT